MAVGPATRLAHYEISAFLGRGGMGEVWRATDTKLGREVALKILPESFVRDPERLARFEREARLLASLQHPNIAAIYGIEEAEGVRFLVMALAEGDDLSVRLQKGPIGVADAIAIAIAIAEGLEAAHERGIVHRDLKPSNIRITQDRQVTILDFGLGKVIDGVEASAELSNSPTMLRAATESGVIIGTAAYMSPEQARGRAVDRRADIWAFGVVVWEMLTGRRLFEGETVSDTLAAVLTTPIDLAVLPDDTPASVRWVLQRCLQRDPRQRLRDIGDARLVLAGPPDMGVATTVPTRVREPRRRAATIATIASLIAIAAITAGVSLRPRPGEPPLRKFDLMLGSTGFGYAPPVISPDGTSILYRVERGVAVRQLDEVAGRLVAEAQDATYACWSPDSRNIAFVSRGRLWRVGRDGKPPIAIARVPNEVAGSGGIAWLPGDRIVLAGSTAAGLLAVSARGGTPGLFVPLSKPAERDFHEVSALPDGRGVLVSIHETGRAVGQIDTIVAGKRQLVLRTGGAESIAGPIYSPTGHVIFEKRTPTRELWAIPFSRTDLRATGEPFLIASGGSPSIANDGTLAYVRGSAAARRQLLRVDRNGEIEAEIGRPADECLFPDVSPDGRRVAASVWHGNGFDIALFDVDTRTMTPLTSRPGVEWQPHWSPDGRQIAMSTGTRDSFEVIDVATGRSSFTADGGMPRWTADGKSIVATIVGADGTLDVAWYELNRKEPVLLIAGPTDDQHANPSPDGGLVAYVSDQTGRDEVFVRELTGERRTIQISSNGTYGPPRWSPSGNEIFYRTEDALWAVRRKAGPRLAFAAPQRLFSFTDTGIDRFDPSFAVTPDGKGFIVTRDLTDDAARPVLTIVTNWLAEFEKQR